MRDRKTPLSKLFSLVETQDTGKQHRYKMKRFVIENVIKELELDELDARRMKYLYDIIMKEVYNFLALPHRFKKRIFRFGEYFVFELPKGIFYKHAVSSRRHIPETLINYVKEKCINGEYFAKKAGKNFMKHFKKLDVISKRRYEKWKLRYEKFLNKNNNEC